ncbi:MAG: tRNA threonylcarbamoyladenosine dehydratase [Bacteroidaceae bacterium]|nr:tRNA threonylcarbamoyladenosine dehydratase [Bacteroidaceae bacterium]
MEKEQQPDIHTRTRRLVGSDAFERLTQTNVLLVGIGGVGSWSAESLVRSGFTRLTIADPDYICASNVNRQIMATSLNIGQPKVEVMRNRLLEINPDAKITAIRKRFCSETAEEFRLEKYDYIIDAIDCIPEKALLIRTALKSGATLISSMGAALKTDPARISVDEFHKVKGCPLAKALRTYFKKNCGFPEGKFMCVYSEERLTNRTHDPLDPGNGTVAHVTASFGLRIASLIFNQVTGL